MYQFVRRISKEIRARPKWSDLSDKEKETWEERAEELEDELWESLGK